MSGGIGILNVGAGDTKLTFDKNNPAECVRAARIVTDMLRRGYALLIDVGGGKCQRVHEFREDTCEYIVADFDPTAPPPAAPKEVTSGQGSTVEAQHPPGSESLDAGVALPRRRGRPGKRAISAHTTTGVAVARSAGG